MQGIFDTHNMHGDRRFIDTVLYHRTFFLPLHNLSINKNLKEFTILSCDHHTAGASMDAPPLSLSLSMYATYVIYTYG
jgi:hypothetical protein